MPIVLALLGLGSSVAGAVAASQDRKADEAQAAAAQAAADAEAARAAAAAARAAAPPAPPAPSNGGASWIPWAVVAAGGLYFLSRRGVSV